MDTTSVTATEGEDDFSAEIPVINTSATTVSLAQTAASPDTCSVDLDDPDVAALSAAKVKVTFDESCFDGATSFDIDFDGAEGVMPKVEIKKPEVARDWAPMGRGALIGGIVALVFAVTSLRIRHRVNDQLLATDSGIGHDKREAAYARVMDLVNARVRELTNDSVQLTWKAIAPPPTVELGSEVSNLEAGWSFKDSWVANLTVATTAFFTLATSVDALTALLGDEPKAALSVMTVSSLLSAVLVAVANTLIKLFGKSTAAVTVAGLLLSSTLVVFAATLQTVTVGVSVDGLVEDTTASRIIVGLTVLVAGVLFWYAVSATYDVLDKTAADNLPKVPADALTAWKATTPGETQLVIDQIRSTYADLAGRRRAAGGRGLCTSAHHDPARHVARRRPGGPHLAGRSSTGALALRARSHRGPNRVPARSARRAAG